MVDLFDDRVVNESTCMPESLPTLTLLETRALGTLVEKQRTVPDTYPLSLNSLVAGCNQKTSRNSVLEVREAEVLLAVENLKALGLVFEVTGSRVVRFAHSLEKALGVPTQASALLTVLMLRGPQTAGANACISLPTSRRSRLFSKNSPRVQLVRWWSSCRACPGRAKTAGVTC